MSPWDVAINPKEKKEYNTIQDQLRQLNQPGPKYWLNLWSNQLLIDFFNPNSWNQIKSLVQKQKKMGCEFNWKMYVLKNVWIWSKMDWNPMKKQNLSKMTKSIDFLMDLVIFKGFWFIFNLLINILIKNGSKSIKNWLNSIAFCSNLDEFNQKLIKIYRILILSFKWNTILSSDLNQTDFDIWFWTACNPNHQRFNS